MEILLLALLLMQTKGEQTDWNATIKKALAFYRENRELITMLVQTVGQKQSTEETSAQQEETIKYRPQSQSDTVGAVNLMEEYLKHHAI